MISSLYKIFQHWSEKGAVWIISDPHFGDADCCLMDPEWPTPTEYIKEINKQIGRNDTLICLGDVGDPNYFKYIRAGYKVLIMGNHDAGRTKYEPYFNEVYEGPLMISPKIMLSHEPILSDYWCNIHGHVHDGVPYNLTEKSIIGINLAPNVWGYSNPFNLGSYIKHGGISKIDDIHRQTINEASMRKEKV